MGLHVYDNTSLKYSTSICF